MCGSKRLLFQSSALRLPTVTSDFFRCTERVAEDIYDIRAKLITYYTTYDIIIRAMRNVDKGQKRRDYVGQSSGSSLVEL
jgi:hypothetical protein